MSAVPADLRVHHSPWRLALPSLLALLAVILGLYWDTALTMVGVWARSDTFAHAFLVPPISLWLIWRQRERLAALTPRPQPWVLLPMLAAAALWLVADLVGVNAAMQFALVAMLVLAVPALLGLEVAHAILFPLLFLFFAVPIGEFLLPVLMEATADFTVAALQLSGIPVFREGRQFIIPSGSWSVVEACSGVRYLIASTMVGTLFAYLNYRSMKRRLLFIGVAIVVPVVANWIRAYMIVMLGHLSGNTIAVGADHLIYGWVFFGIVIMIMFAIGARWSEPDDLPIAAQASARRANAATGAAFVTPATMMASALAAAVVVGLPTGIGQLIERAEASAADPHLVLPARLAGPWVSQGAQIVAWKPRFEQASTEASQAYTNGGRTVGLYLAYYRGQNPGRKLVSSQNVLVTSKDQQWNAVSEFILNLPSGEGGGSVKAAELLGVAGPGSVRRPHLAVWQWYWVDGRWISGDAEAKVRGAIARLRGRGDEGASLVLYADDDSVTTATATLEAFTRTNLDTLGELLRQTRDRR